MSTAEEIAASALAALNSFQSSNDLHTKKGEMAKMSSHPGKTQPTTQYGKASDATVSTKRRKGPKPKVKLPLEPRTIHFVPKRKEYVNHTYRDLSVIPIQIGQIVPTEISEMSFAEKVHDMLSQKVYSNFLEWRPHGRAFRILVPSLFEKMICPKYFEHKRYSSFLRQLNNHGFKLLTKGKDRNCYYHECVVRGLPHLCKYMSEPKDARRMIPDPENEPDFHALSVLHPLPSEASVSEDEESQGDKKPAALKIPKTDETKLIYQALPSHSGISDEVTQPMPKVMASTATRLPQANHDPSSTLQNEQKPRSRSASELSGFETMLPPAKRPFLMIPVSAASEDNANASNVVSDGGGKYKSQQEVAAADLTRLVENSFGRHSQDRLQPLKQQALLEEMMLRDAQLRHYQLHRIQEERAKMSLFLKQHQERQLILLRDQNADVQLDSPAVSTNKHSSPIIHLLQIQQQQSNNGSRSGQQDLNLLHVLRQSQQKKSSVVDFLRRKSLNR